MRAIGYIRVSTDRQADEGASLEAQTSAIEQECTARGWQLARCERDTASGKNAERPGLRLARLRIAELAGTGEAAALVVARLDRLSRSPIDVYDLMDQANRQGWALVCLDPPIYDMTTPFGRALAGMAAVFAQLERELIGQRTREGIAAKKATGTYRGGRLLPQAQPVPADVVARIMRLAGQGASSMEIAGMLDQLGVPTPRGGAQWSDRTVRSVIARELAA